MTSFVLLLHNTIYNNNFERLSKSYSCGIKQMSCVPKLRLLLLPGFGNSGPKHWQSIWEAQQPFTEGFPNSDIYVERMQHSSWFTIEARVWYEELRHELERDPKLPTILIAHSLGCLDAFMQNDTKNVRGAFLVAPANPEREGFPESIKGFAVPRNPLKFPAILVASENDPYAPFGWSKTLAATLKVKQFLSAGSAGHINAESGLEEWKSGQAWVRELIRIVLD